MLLIMVGLFLIYTKVEESHTGADGWCPKNQRPRYLKFRKCPPCEYSKNMCMINFRSLFGLFLTYFSDECQMWRVVMFNTMFLIFPAILRSSVPFKLLLHYVYTCTYFLEQESPMGKTMKNLLMQWRWFASSVSSIQFLRW